MECHDNHSNNNSALSTYIQHTAARCGWQQQQQPANSGDDDDDDDEVELLTLLDCGRCWSACADVNTCTQVAL